jgi:CMP-N-acetylneuraminic acid synthetase
MKNVNDILFIVQARTNSERVPNKMLRAFAGTNLMEICLLKIKQSNIPNNNFYASVHEPELVDLVKSLELQVFPRSLQSANEEHDIRVMYEWHDRFPQFKYAVIINACNLFLSVDTINRFLEHYVNSEHDGLFSVVPKRQYFWNQQGDLITKWPKGFNIMNTKYVDETYEAGHCLYAGKLNLISAGKWMGEPPYTKNDPELFYMSELESLDIDHEWQFDIYTNYWRVIHDKGNC